MLLVVDCGSWCCFKRPFEDVGDVHVCDRSVTTSLNLLVLRGFFVRQFTPYQLPCVTEIFYVCWLKLFWN